MIKKHFVMEYLKMCRTTNKIIKNPRKEYKCYLCEKTINSEHIYNTTFAYGSVSHNRFHKKCYQIMEHVCKNCPYPFGNCEEDPFQCFHKKLEKMKKI